MGTASSQPRILIVYGSSKGRTGRIANIVAEVLDRAGCETVVRNVFESRPDEIPAFRYVVLGSSTYGQGDLQRDFLEYERGMDHLDLTGVRAAVFGSGNSRYAYFAEAVDILEAKLKILNARILLPPFRQDMMDGPPEDSDVRSWAEQLVRAVLADAGL